MDKDLRINELEIQLERVLDLFEDKLAGIYIEVDTAQCDGAGAEAFPIPTINIPIIEEAIEVLYGQDQADGSW